MPRFALWLFGLIQGAAAFLANYVSKKVAVAAAWGVFLVVGWAALQASVYALWTGLGYVTPPLIKDAMVVVLYLLPSNTVACFNAFVVARIARWVWAREREYARGLYGVS